MTLPPFETRSLKPGQGRIVSQLSSYGPAGPSETRLPILSSAYPLKLLALDASSSSTSTDPPIDSDSLQSQLISFKHVYLLGYGGGMLSGDAVQVDVVCGRGTGLALLTQGSTKVYRIRRSGAVLDGLHGSLEDGGKRETMEEGKQGVARPPGSSQILKHIVEEGAALFLLPEPVVPFSQSRFFQNQVITFQRNSKGTGSLVLLDWFTSGRMARGEAWMWDAYESGFEIHLEDEPSSDDAPRSQKLLLKDRLELADSLNTDGPTTTKSYAAALQPYPVHATFLLIGPLLSNLSSFLLTSEQYVGQFPYGKQPTKAPPLIWSVSELPRTCTREGIQGCLLRIAGMETEVVRAFVSRVLNEEEGGSAVKEGCRVFARLL